MSQPCRSLGVILAAAANPGWVGAPRRPAGLSADLALLPPGRFPQRAGPGSEAGNSLLCPEEAPCSSVCGVLGMLQCQSELTLSANFEEPGLRCLA